MSILTPEVVIIKQNAELESVRAELDELRAENERGWKGLTNLYTYITGHVCETKYALGFATSAVQLLKARAEKAEADLEKALADAQKVEADNVALRIGLSKALGTLSSIAADFPYGSSQWQKADKLDVRELLASPDPGAGVRAVVEAAKQFVAGRLLTMEHPLDRALYEAVRALRGGEGA